MALGKIASLAAAATERTENVKYSGMLEFMLPY